jgi:acid phosphatase
MQTYRIATERLPAAIADASWSAIPAQADALAANPQRMPMAVILDLDETVIDNSGFQAELIRDNTEFSPERWTEWANKSMARAVPGAIGFIRACRDSGVRVFFVTNREFEVEEATRRNLVKLGIIKEDDGDNILTKKEREDWGSNKSTRRDFLALDLRILMLIGDDLNDFVWTGKNPSPEQRRAETEKYRSYFGERWFVLPNPNYGGWERSLYGYDNDSSREEKLQGKLDHLWDSK